MVEQNDLGPTARAQSLAATSALVLYAPESMIGAEIEISPAGGGAKRHVAVRERRTGATCLCAALCPSLEAGEYFVWNLASTPAGTVRIAGGAVTELSIDIPTLVADPQRFSLSSRT